MGFRICDGWLEVARFLSIETEEGTRRVDREDMRRIGLSLRVGVVRLLVVDVMIFCLCNVIVFNIVIVVPVFRIAGVNWLSKDSVLGEHQGGLIHLEVSRMLRVIVVGGFGFLLALLFIPLSFATFSINVARFSTVAAGFGAAVAYGRAMRLAFSFRFAFATFAFTLARGVSVACGSTVR
jgi:hypothetical protein